MKMPKTRPRNLVRFGKRILLRGDLLSVRVERHRINKQRISLFLEDLGRYEIRRKLSFERFGSPASKTEVYLIDTADLLPGTYRLFVGTEPSEISGEHLFSIVEDHHHLEVAYEEMVGEADEQIMFEYLDFLSVQSLLNSLEISLPTKFDTTNDRMTQILFLSSGIPLIFEHFLNEEDEIHVALEIPRQEIEYTGRLNFDVGKVIWMLQCYALLFRDLVNLSGQTNLKTGVNGDRLTIQIDNESGNLLNLNRDQVSLARHPNESVMSTLTRSILNDPLSKVIGTQFGESLEISSENAGQVIINLLIEHAELPMSMSAAP